GPLLPRPEEAQGALHGGDGDHPRGEAVAGALPGSRGLRHEPARHLQAARGLSAHRVRNAALALGGAVADRMPLLDIGQLRARVDDLRARKGPPPWSDTLVMTDDIQAFIICHLPGHPNDTHYHLHDEWWIVLQGEIDWYIEGEPGPVHARAGDFVL